MGILYVPIYNRIVQYWLQKTWLKKNPPETSEGLYQKNLNIYLFRLDDYLFFGGFFIFNFDDTFSKQRVTT